MLIIENLKQYEELELSSMNAIKGGFDPFAHSGLSYMMDDLKRRWVSDPSGDESAPDTILDPGYVIAVEDYNHTTISSKS